MSTTVHIPEELLRKIDESARSNGISRNRFVIRACTDALARQAGTWPRGFFEINLTDEDLSLLRETSAALERDVLSSRRNRGGVLL